MTCQIATSAYHLVLASIVWIAAALAFPISLVLIWLYRRAVRKYMRRRAHPPHAPRRPFPPLCRQSPSGLPEIAVMDNGSVGCAEDDAVRLQAEAVWAPWRTAAVYVVAGVSHALVFALALNAALGNNVGLSDTLFRLIVFAWPAVLTVNLVAATNVRAKIKTAFVYFVALAAGCVAISVVTGFKFSLETMVQTWFAANGPTSVLLLTFLNRRVRAVGPLVLIFMLVAVAGLHLSIYASGITDDKGSMFAIEMGAVIGLHPHATFFLIAAAGFVAAGPVGWLGLRWVRRRYEQKKMSDQSVIVDAIWLLFSIVNSLVLSFNNNVAWALSGLVSFATYKLVARAGFALLGRRKAAAPRKSTRLLLLRVFALGRRSERLFTALAKHWRHVGSIQLIAGYDLATETVEPHKFLDFLSGKLARRFIDDQLSFELSIAELDTAPDRDGRYRVNEFFCREDTWKMVLSGLASKSDVVLMDLRGFTEQNAGCVFEIKELINLVPFGRVKFIVDVTTDEKFLHWVVQRSWCEMRVTSPNQGPVSMQPGLFRLTGSDPGELRQLLRALCVASRTV